LKLSSFGARWLYEKNYQFNVMINWVNELNQDIIELHLTEFAEKHSKKQLGNSKPFNLPSRLWLYLLNKSSIKAEVQWQDLGKKIRNKLIAVLCNDVYSVKGKTTFKEEFVTCGGISLDSIDFASMKSRAISNLYFAGELLDIDGITGGYNFQAAWTTAFIAAQLK
ncbi:MAG: NAD(P)/FAD-dependent oxidoreductase, partial [Bacteroidia bacterium]|nr:NAD(P)/FAD-dependent oxidoreductase [Bacteroidia bacterium]